MPFAVQIEFARQERLVVGRVVPRRDAGNEGVGQRLGVFQRLHGLRRVDDDLVVLVDGVGAVTPQDPVHPGVGVAGGMSEREAGRRIVRLQRLAHGEIAREIRREFLESRPCRQPTCGRSCSRRWSQRECRASHCPACRSLRRHRSSRHTSCRDSRQRRSSSALWSGTVAAGYAGPRPCRGPSRYSPPPKPSAARPRRIREHVHLGAGRRLERRDHGVERIVLGRHEALPAHHGELGALFRLPWRGLRPGLGKFQQGRPGKCAGRSKRGAALKYRSGE